jgi:hypothetical protein
LSVREIVIYENIYFLIFVLGLSSIYSILYHIILLKDVSSILDLYLYALSIFPYLIVACNIILIFRYINKYGVLCIPEFVLSGIYIFILITTTIPYILFTIFGNPQLLIISSGIGVALLGVFFISFEKLFLFAEKHINE